MLAFYDLARHVRFWKKILNDEQDGFIVQEKNTEDTEYKHRARGRAVYSL